MAEMGSLEMILGNELIVLFAIIGLGLLLGNLTLRGIGLGSSGVLFAALLAGHFGLSIPSGVGDFGLVVFVYCIGIGAGPRFFPALAREGGGLAKLAFAIVGSALLVAWGLGRLLDLPADLTAGLFAGALTSTPALAAASEGAFDGGQGVAIGYGIAYPFGVISVVLFVQVVPRLLKSGVSDEDAIAEADARDGLVGNLLVSVQNEDLIGRKISDFESMGMAFRVSRVLRGERLVPLEGADIFGRDQVLMLVGQRRDLEIAAAYLGKKVERPMVIDTENERRRLVVTSKRVSGLALHGLSTLSEYGVVLTRVTRLGQTFVPTADTRIELNDMLTAVGNPESLARFAERIGHRPLDFDQTDLVSLALGLTAGVLLGMLPFGLPGGEPFTLGMAGGPLFVALALGYFGKIGRLVGFIPRPARLLLQEFGLVLFLAHAGVKGGASLGATVAQYGVVVFAVGAAISLAPLVVAYPLARKCLGLNQGQALGGICGGMTSTPALGAITASSSSQLPIVSYATAYPIALILMTVLAKTLVELLG